MLIDKCGNRRPGRASGSIDKQLETAAPAAEARVRWHRAQVPPPSSQLPAPRIECRLVRMLMKFIIVGYVASVATPIATNNIRNELIVKIENW